MGISWKTEAARPFRLFVALAACAAAAGASRACPIPVYQYALEHWTPDRYEAVVHVPGAWSQDARAALELLQAAGQGDSPRANLNVRTAAPQDDVSNAHARVEVFYPGHTGIRRPVWSGALSLDNVRALLSSPVRRQLGEALLRRTSAVWLLLESGDRRADRELESRLQARLSRLAAELTLPDTAQWGGETVIIDSPVNFSILRLRRDDPAERMLVRMLLASEPDLEADFAGQPMVFPVYGRGLILYALVGNGINDWTLGEAARFLAGPCSCQIKAANPGTDILMSVDWDAGIQPLAPASVGGATGTGAFLRSLDDASQVP